MEVREVNPYDVNVSDLNERTENITVSELEKSVAEQGVIQPPMVRQRNGDSEVSYEVVVGQRRTIAAQGAGLDSIPVVVMDWDDAEALEASITENIDQFREDVSPKDRAVALQRLMEIKGLNGADLARRLGVERTTIYDWLEFVREEWEGTTIHAEPEKQQDPSSDQEVTTLETPDTRKVRMTRQMTGGGIEGEEVLTTVEEEGLGKDDVHEAKKRVENAGLEPREAIEKVAEEKKEQQKSGIRVRAEVTFAGESGKAIEEASKDVGASPNEIVQMAVEEWLEEREYL